MAAAEHLRTAALLCERLGERAWLAQTLTWLGYGVQYAEGDRAAIDSLTRALHALDPGTRRHALTAVLAAEVLAGLGRDADAADLLAVARREGAALDDHRVLAHAAWQEAELAALAGERAWLVVSLELVERHRGDWFDHPTGILFLAQAADLCRRVGLLREASTYLDRACERAGAEGVPDVPSQARGALAAVAGDPVEAERVLVAVLDSDELDARERWRVMLLRAAAARRCGDPIAADLAAEALDRAAALGLAELVPRKEPALVDLLGLQPAVVEPGPASGEASPADVAVAASPAPPIEVTLLGGFAVARDGRAVTPVGQPAALVKLVALAGGPLAVDVVLDDLWPDADVETARRRLRNLLNRLRDQSGEVVIRADGALSLPVGAVVDAAAFEQSASAALVAGGDEVVVRANEALAWWGGELLPADRYDDRIEGRRQRLRRLWLAVVDLLVAHHEGQGDRVVALALVERAVEVSPYDEDRWVRAIGLAVELGRVEQAVRYVERALASLDELGVPPGPELSALARRLTGSARR